MCVRVPLCAYMRLSLLYLSPCFLPHNEQPFECVCVCRCLVSLISISIVLIEKKGRRASPPPPPPLPHSLRPSRQPPSGLLPSGSFHLVVGFFAVSKQDKTGADCICSPLAADVGFGEAGAAERGGSMHIRYLTKGRKEAGSYVNRHLLS